MNGAAIVEEMDATTVVSPGYHATVDGHGNLLISPDEPAADFQVSAEQLAINGVATTGGRAARAP